jgi:hypothetical protein
VLIDGLRINLQSDTQEALQNAATTTSTSQTNMDDFEIKQPIGKIYANNQ